ncbi:MAG: VanW family protein [Clostridia bacterium]|nr:VanW family protein [Clostridia bacterium]
MLFKNKNFCDINPFFWTISTYKCILVRKARDLFSKENFSKTKQTQKLSNLVYEYSTVMIKKGKEIDPRTQENKAVNIKVASSKINGIIIRPGETFSFWKTVGSVNKRKGYKDGRVLKSNKLVTGTGGGLCNLANAVNNLVLHTPLQIVEFHKHSDALACDIGHRVPMANGTSVNYNYIDYRFKNNTDQNIQILLWCDDTKLYGELRSERDFPLRYELIEEDHHFEKNDDKYYRISKIYRNTIDKETENLLNKELIWDNHSQVMFDYNLIPKEEIKQ